MTRYAKNTEVPADRSRVQIEKVLQRYGADQFMYAWQSDGAVIGFRMSSRMVRFFLPFPNRKEFEKTANGRSPNNTVVIGE